MGFGPSSRSGHVKPLKSPKINSDTVCDSKNNLTFELYDQRVPLAGLFSGMKSSLKHKAQPSLLSITEYQIVLIRPEVFSLRPRTYTTLVGILLYGIIILTTFQNITIMKSTNRERVISVFRIGKLSYYFSSFFFFFL